MSKYKVFRRKIMRKYSSKKQKKKDLASKRIAVEVAKDITGSDNVTVAKRHIPKSMVSYIEKNVKIKFKKRPKFYTYKPKRGHRFKPKNECGGWDGASVTSYDINNGKIQNTIVVLPNSHLKDKRLKENVLLHELTETLVGQHMINPGTRRSASKVTNFEHGIFAMAYEKKHLDKHKMTRRQMSDLAKKMWNEEMTKKAEK
jgi:hypothetical protein